MTLPRPISYRMIIVELLSDLGNQCVHLTLLATLFFGRSDGTVNLLFICLVQQLPAIIFGPPVGRLLDHTGPKQGLLAANMLKSACLVGLLVVPAGWGVWALYILFMTASLLFFISRMAITPHIINRQHLVTYNALNERVALAAAVAGPWLIGLTIRYTGNSLALALGLGMFIGSAILAVGLPAPGKNRPSARSAVAPNNRQRLWQAYVEPLCARRVRNWILLLGVVNLGGGLMNFGQPLFNKTFFAGDIAVWGGAMSCFQAGAFLSTYLLPRLTGYLPDHRLLSWTCSCIAASVGLLALFTSLPLFLALTGVFGCGATLIFLLIDSRIQRNCAENMRNRTMAAIATYRALLLLGGILAGMWVASAGNVRWVMAVGAVVLLGGVPIALRQRGNADHKSN